MKLNALTAAGLLSASLILGCDDGSTTTATPAAPAPTVNDGAKDAAAGLQKQAADAQAGAANVAADAKTAATDAGNSVVAQAQALYAQATTAIGSAKLDDAQKYVDQLKGLRDKLPADWQVKVDEVAKMLTDAKAKLGNLPSMPAMPK